MKKNIKKMLFPLYFYLVPQKNASYAYKCKRILTNVTFSFKKLFNNSYHLSSSEISQRNRGDAKIELNENVIPEQFEILERYQDFITDTVLNKDTSKSILDVGSRDGSLLENLKNFGYTDVTGFEIVSDWVKYCHKKGMSYIHEVNLLELDTLNHKKYDLVFSRHTLEHVDRTELFFDKLVDLIQTNGKLFIVFPLNKKANFKHPSYLPSIEHIRNAFDFSRLSNVRLERLDAFSIKSNWINLTDSRETDEIIITATKL